MPERKKYNILVTQDGSHIAVEALEDTHLLAIIHDLEDRVLFRRSSDDRLAWTTVMKGEALKRGLDWRRPDVWFSVFALALTGTLGQFIKHTEQTLRNKGIPVPMVVLSPEGVVKSLSWGPIEGGG